MNKQCRKCVNAQRQKTCDVCEARKAVSHFPASQLHNEKDRNTLLRCEACHVCVRCKTKRCANEFLHNDKQCRTCTNAARVLRCEACKDEKAKVDFDKSNLEHTMKTSRSDRLVCKKCVAKGCSSKDVTLYTCAICGPRGHKAFQRKGAPCCMDCLKTHERCVGCSICHA